MLYLRSFTFPDAAREERFLQNDPRTKQTCYRSVYPFGVLCARGLARLECAPITLLAGGNGCGKSTALRVMAEKLGLRRDTPGNHSAFFEDYMTLCEGETAGKLPGGSRLIASDDVFEFMLSLRALNQGIDRRREELLEDYRALRRERFQMRSLADFDHLREVNEARRRTASRFVRNEVPDEAREHSNGESALLYFREAMDEGALYLLDEPENSLSPQRQEELGQFLTDSVRFFGCQLIIATHSPVFLSLSEAKVVDLDGDPARTCRWTELPAMRAWHDFFEAHRREFG